MAEPCRCYVFDRADIIGVSPSYSSLFFFRPDIGLLFELDEFVLRADNFKSPSSDFFSVFRADNNDYGYVLGEVPSIIKTLSSDSFFTGAAYPQNPIPMLEPCLFIFFLAPLLGETPPDAFSSSSSMFLPIVDYYLPIVSVFPYSSVCNLLSFFLGETPILEDYRMGANLKAEFYLYKLPPSCLPIANLFSNPTLPPI